jgi:hypothetical protein
MLIHPFLSHRQDRILSFLAAFMVSQQQRCCQWGLPAGFILKMVYDIIGYYLQMENEDEEEKRKCKERTRRD